MLALLLKLIDPIAAVTSGILEFLKLRQQAKTSEELAQIDLQVKRLGDQRDVLVAAQANTFSRDVFWTLCFIGALGPTIWILKRFLWDGAIGPFYGCVGKYSDYVNCLAFNTDKLSSNDWWVIATVFTFLFLGTKR